MNNTSFKGYDMNTMQEDLARAQMTARLGEAQALRQGRRIVVARRLTRRAERAALQGKDSPLAIAWLQAALAGR